MKLLMSAMALLLLVSSAQGETPDRETRARQLYEEGKSAYNKAEYQVAYDRFWESFQLSHVPALLYNVASALQGLKRPHDAAEALRSYLRLRPDDSDKPQIEERIAALEEEQRLLVTDQQEKTPAPTPAVTAPVASPLVAAPPPPEKPRKRTALIVGLTIGAAVVVGVAVGVGVAFAPQKSQPYTPSPTVGGPIRSTQ